MRKLADTLWRRSDHLQLTLLQACQFLQPGPGIHATGTSETASNSFKRALNELLNMKRWLPEQPPSRTKL